MKNMSGSKIVVIGSSNTDMVVRTSHFPEKGETVLGGEFMMNPGGKGANQAVAAARMGGDVVFVCKIGKDAFGSHSAELFKKEGIDVSCILLDEDSHSGVALITVDAHAENTIVVASGANANLFPKDIRGVETLFSANGHVLLQLEIPVETVRYIAKVASLRGAKVILNPAPACELPEEMFGDLYLLTPNEKEASAISGISVIDLDSAKEAAQVIYSKGVKNVIITMGSKGALIFDGTDYVFIEAQKVEAVDTTAAGDVFNGALIVALNEGRNLVEAADFANKASAIAVTRMGAQASAPYRNEIMEDVSK